MNLDNPRLWRVAGIVIALGAAVVLGMALDNWFFAGLFVGMLLG